MSDHLFYNLYFFKCNSTSTVPFYEVPVANSKFYASEVSHIESQNSPDYGTSGPLIFCPLADLSII
jgi:hypothetical protein